MNKTKKVGTIKQTSEEEKKLLKQFKKDAEKCWKLLCNSIIRDEVRIFIEKYHCVDCGTRVNITKDFCGHCGGLTKPRK